MRNSLIGPAALALAACTASNPAENAADMLENAADQSTPAAAESLDDAADNIRENGATGAPADPDGSVQTAIEDAANAQARSVS
jgi:predicted lipoprotein